MALEKCGTVTNSTGIDPGTGTYLTEIRERVERIGIEANGNDGTFQEAAKLRTKKSYTLRGYGESDLDPGLNDNEETSDGPFVDSVENTEQNEELDQFAVAGHEYGS